jgi:hypothetical protein
MKETAVQWFALKVMYLKMNPKEVFEFLGWLEQAKEMEREQIIRARQDGLDNGFSNGSWDSNLYYNETYGDK